ncbi:MAG: hypothetical protein ACON5H_05310 [Akkermansiaceae bacterium]
MKVRPFEVQGVQGTPELAGDAVKEVDWNDCQSLVNVGELVALF